MGTPALSRSLAVIPGMQLEKHFPKGHSNTGVPTSDRLVAGQSEEHPMATVPWVVEPALSVEPTSAVGEPATKAVVPTKPVVPPEAISFEL
jgi:hypothetical protein